VPQSQRGNKKTTKLEDTTYRGEKVGWTGKIGTGDDKKTEKKLGGDLGGGTGRGGTKKLEKG